MTLSFTAGEMEGFFDYITVYDGPDATGPVLATLELDFAGQSFTATNPEGCISFQVTSDGFCSCGDLFCGFEPVEWCVGCGEVNNACAYDWLWEPAEYFVDNTVPQPAIQNLNGEAVEFTLSVEPVGIDNCQATDVVLVAPAFELELADTQPTCSANDGVIEVEILEGTATLVDPFTIGLYLGTAMGDSLLTEAVGSSSMGFVRDGLIPGDYRVEVTDGNGCGLDVAVGLMPPDSLTCWRVCGS